VAFETAATIISDAAIDLGLTPAAIANPYGSTDANILQLCSLLKRAGRGLLREYSWSHLKTVHTFSTGSGTASYALPTDFNRIIDGTVWNRTQDYPLSGPLSPQKWEELQALGSSIARQAFRIFGNLFYIYSTPSAIETIAYEYQSRYWVDLGGGSTPDAETPTAAADTLHFDPDLLVADLKLRFTIAKGLDSTAVQAERDALFSAATGADGAAPVLDMAGATGMRFLSDANLPDTGVGS
jgi:hypothetical protein